MASTEAAAAGAIDFPALKNTNWVSDENGSGIGTGAGAGKGKGKGSAEKAYEPMLFTPHFHLSDKAATPTLSFKPLESCKRAGLLSAAKGEGLFCVYYEVGWRKETRRVGSKRRRLISLALIYVG